MSVYVYEYETLGLVDMGSPHSRAQLLKEPPLARHKITAGNATPAFNAKTAIIAVYPEEDIHGEAGLNATADATSMPYNAREIRHFCVERDAGHRFSTISR